MDETNERNTWFTDHSFTDENGDPTTPISASYRIDDVGSNTEIKGDTAFPGLDESVTIIWDPSDTQILEDSHAYEVRRMTVSWLYNSSTSPAAESEGHAEYYLRVWNLRGFVSPSPA